jgi:6-phosphogluconolactonase
MLKKSYFWTNYKIRKMKKNIIVFLLVISALSNQVQSQQYRLLIGTYTDTGKSKGIYSYKIDMKTGVFTEKSVMTNVTNPSYLAITPDKKFVYSVNESTDSSAVNAFSFNSETGKLKLLNRSLTKSSGACFVMVSDKNVFTANYGGGSLSVFGRKPNGSITAALQVIQHVGKSINTERQNEPHVHQVLLSPDKKFVVVNDLGTDKVTVYQYDPKNSTDVLIPFDTLTVKLGSGPRHGAFNKSGSLLYLAQEIDGTVSVLKMKDGKLSIFQETTVNRKPGTVNRTADIHLSSDEKFLYVTNRGSANNITCFAIGNNGKLTFVQQVSTGGNGPRNFSLTPDGKYIFVAHQFTDNITIFKRDSKTGKMENTGKEMKVGAPVCLKFY